MKLIQILENLTKIYALHVARNWINLKIKLSKKISLKNNKKYILIQKSKNIYKMKKFFYLKLAAKIVKQMIIESKIALNSHKRNFKKMKNLINKSLQK